jgi:hypothetical protein
MITDNQIRSRKVPFIPPPDRDKSAWVKGEFLRGPIPLSWLSVVLKMGNLNAVKVAMAILWESGRRGGAIQLTSASMSRFHAGDARNVKSRGIKALEGAGLIAVDRQPRKNPIITILEISK